jgi:S-formylglutathione hydrolase FrmB
LPSIWLLAGFTGRGGSYLNLNPWQETLCERLDRLSSEGLPPVRVILPDCFTRLGGSQYLDSPAIGPYATYLWDELRVQLEAEYVTPHRGVMGKSSGGFGSFYSVMTHPGLFQAMASHSGDMLFPWAYLPDFPRAYQIIEDCGSVAQFLQCFEKNPDKSSAWINAMNIIAMAYAYSPNLNNAGVPADFPLDFDTLQVDTPVWEKWLRFDPLKMVDEPLFQNALRQLSGLYFDAGKKDEFQLQYGAMQMDAKLTRYNIVHRFELYDGGHFRTSHRLDISLAFLAGALTSDGG